MFYRLYVRTPTLQLLQIGHKSDKWQWRHKFQYDAIVRFLWSCRVSFSYWSKFHVNIITSSRVMAIFLCKGLTRNWKSEIPPSKFCSIYGNWGKLEIPNLSRMSLMKCYWMLQNARFTAFTVSALLRETSRGW